MIGAKTSVKLLMRLGIALIFAPEPFTTPFGVALVFAARYLSKRREARVNMHLREMVGYYLAHTNNFSGDADGKSSAPSSLKRYTQSEEHPIHQQYTGSRSFEANLTASVWQNWHDMRDRTVHHAVDMQSLSGHCKAGDIFKVECARSGTSRGAEKVIHHTINMKLLSQRYEGQGSTVAHSNWAHTSGVGKGVMHHSLNMKLLSQRYNTGGAGHTKARYHTVNMALVQKCYGLSVSYSMALNALQNNNYYYDVVCRGNVIGGY